MVIVTDDESRENEGDLIMAASKVTPEAVNKMIVHGRGLICVPLLSNQLTRLGISSMVPHNREAQTDGFYRFGRCRRRHYHRNQRVRPLEHDSNFGQPCR